MWLAFAFVGWWWAFAWVTSPVGRWIVFALHLGIIAPTFVSLFGDGLVDSQDCAILAGAAFFVCGFVSMVHVSAIGARGRTYGGGGWSSGGRLRQSSSTASGMTMGGFPRGSTQEYSLACQALATTGTGR